MDQADGITNKRYGRNFLPEMLVVTKIIVDN